MDFAILALTDRFDPSGVICLASILWMIIVLIAYAFGPISGSFTCCIFFVIALCATMDSRSQSGGGSIVVTEHMITNRSETKWLKQPTGRDLDKGNAFFMITTEGTSTPLDDEQWFIPDEEIMIVDGSKRMKPDGRKIHSYSFARPEILKNRDWSNPNGWVYGDWGDSDSYLYKNKHGKIVKVNTGRPPKDDDFYIINKIIDNMHVPKEFGGWGWPQWVYHPASAVYVFGIGALPIILMSGLVVGKATGIG